MARELTLEDFEMGWRAHAPLHPPRSGNRDHRHRRRIVRTLLRRETVGMGGGGALDRLRIGVIGLGWFGEIHCEAIIGMPNLELAALCTRTERRLGELATKFGVQKTFTDYRDMLADPEIDAVSIVTMWDQHTEPTIAALEAGKHVFLEKPMASTVADCRDDHRRGGGGEGHPAGRPHLPLQPALPRGQAGDRGRARSAGSSR